MGDFGELGPLDVQMLQRDELDEYTSGLTVSEAIDALREDAFNVFEMVMLSIKKRSYGQITFSKSDEIALKMASFIVTPIASQIEPVRMGEYSRSMRIAQEYGARLSRVSQNLKGGGRADTLQQFLRSYPSRGFAINAFEASELFLNVSAIDVGLKPILEELKALALYPMERPEDTFARFLNDEAPCQGDKGGRSPEQAREGTFETWTGEEQRHIGTREAIDRPVELHGSRASSGDPVTAEDTPEGLHEGNASPGGPRKVEDAPVDGASTPSRRKGQTRFPN